VIAARRAGPCFVQRYRSRDVATDIVSRAPEGKPLAEHRLIEIGPDGAAGPAVAVKLAQPLPSFFNATVRAGCRPSNVIDVLGEHSGKMRYARVRIE